MPTTAALHFHARAPIPPPTPCPWLWRCHACHIWYRLATTRRCLECDHAFCLTDNTSSPHSTRATSKKRKRSGGPCRAEFDYIGWAARGAWRRTILLNVARRSPQDEHTQPRAPPTLPEPTAADEEEQEEGGLLLLGTPAGHRRGRWLPQSALATAWGDEHRALEHGIDQLTERFAEKKEALYVRRRHNCWLHCDFPSECHHAVHKAQQDGKPVLARARALDEGYLAEVRAERAVSQGLSGVKRITSAGIEVNGSGKPRLESLGRSLTVVKEEEEEESSDSDSDSDSSDSDEDEIIEGQEPESVSPVLPGDEHAAIHIRTSLDMEEDYSYSAFKKATGVDSTLISISISSPTSTVTTTATTLPISIPIPIPATSTTTPLAATALDDDTKDLNTPLATTKARKRHYNAKKAHLFPLTTPCAAAAPLTNLHSFEPFWTVLPADDAAADATYPPRTTATPMSRDTTAAPVSPTTPERRLLQDLEQAYSAQAWYPPSSSSSSRAGVEPNTHRQRRPGARRSRASRAENTARMLTLLGRRTSCSPTTHSNIIPEVWEDSDTTITTTTWVPSSSSSSSFAE